MPPTLAIQDSERRVEGVSNQVESRDLEAELAAFGEGVVDLDAARSMYK